MKGGIRVSESKQRRGKLGGIIEEGGKAESKSIARLNSSQRKKRKERNKTVRLADILSKKSSCRDGAEAGKIYRGYNIHMFGGLTRTVTES